MPEFLSVFMNPDYDPDPDQKFLVPDYDAQDDVVVEAFDEVPSSDEPVAAPVVDESVADTTEQASAPASTEGN